MIQTYFIVSKLWNIRVATAIIKLELFYLLILSANDNPVLFTVQQQGLVNFSTRSLECATSARENF